ncbi:hypothetical protein NCCP1664_03060 [Zafaria cholistanensis]|uniref:DUF1003 domain-containing protein n=1 Tax=Zafaria cholistanensis TaxID=1682741 RepID=A0A5A7NMN5_9MICC|nr:DUF1003 domain-containing protein [Zafaria cholistanensis]GER21809.1 hypothetical protein NCCP1664_03060 [Zafaria cholistanensis]
MADKTTRHSASSSASGLDTPLSAKDRFWPRFSPNPDLFGSATEKFARFMGTPAFLLWMTVFCVAWLAWNTWGPEQYRFDSAVLGFTALTLMLSLQASYAAPLLLLAQNRQDDRDRVSLTEDRNRAERNLHDTEYLTRELAALRIALRDVATRDYVRSELRSALEELLEANDGEEIRLRGRAPRKREKVSEATTQLTQVSRKADYAGRKPSGSGKRAAAPGKHTADPTAGVGPGAGTGPGVRPDSTTPRAGEMRDDAPRQSDA